MICKQYFISHKDIIKRASREIETPIFIFFLEDYIFHFTRLYLLDNLHTFFYGFFIHRKQFMMSFRQGFL